MKVIQLILTTGFALFIATAGAQLQVSLQEVKTAAASIRGLTTGDQAIDTVFSLKNSRNYTLLYECRFNDGKAVLMSGSKACIPVLGYYNSFSKITFKNVQQ